MLAAPGIGSGLDIAGIIDKLMQVERRPLQQLNSKEAKQQAQLSAYGSLKSALSSLQDSVKALSKPALFDGFKATLTDTALADVTTSSVAVAGTYQIEVQSLAQAQKIKSTAFAATDEVVGSGTLTIAFGKYGEDDSFTANAEKAAVTITIDPDKATLADIRNAINDANAGVTASIVNDGVEGHRLVISSKETGTINALQVTASDPGLSELASGMTETVAAQDAKMVIDGIQIVQASNTISDALEGVTFNLRKADLGNTTTLTIEKDNGSVKAAVEAFVKNYNELEKTVNNLSRYDATNKQGSVLTGDSTVRMVQSRVRATLNGNPSGAGNISGLHEIGVSFQKDGTLALDSKKLEAALSDPDKDVAAFFVPQVGGGVLPSADIFTTRLDQLIDGMVRSDGLISGRLEGINSVIKGIGKQRESLEYRLSETEKRLQAQFTALDTMIASMTQTSNYLQQQLASLPKMGDK